MNIIKIYSPKQDFVWTGVVDVLQKGLNGIQQFVADFVYIYIYNNICL